MNSLIKTMFFDPSKHPKLAIITDKTKFTYKDLLFNIFCLKEYLSRLSIHKNQTVSIYMNDCPEYVFLFWACIFSGIRPILINKKMNRANLDYLYSNSNSVYLISDIDLEYDNQAIVKLDDIRSYLNTKECTEELNFSNIDCLPSDVPSFYLCTSGSTGNSKIIPHTLDDVLNCIESFQATSTCILPEDLIFSVSKIPFAYGFGNSVYLPFYAGATVFICEYDSISQIYKSICRNNPTVVFGVPTFFNAILKLYDNINEIGSKFRMCISCGETLPNVVFEEWSRRTNNYLVEGMGTTELLYIFFINSLHSPKSGSVGTLVPGYSARIIKKDGSEAEINEVGELFVSGRSCWNKEVSEISTGDLFYRDAGNNYYYCGRTNDLFKINGNWFKSSTIENELIRQSEINEAMVRVNPINKTSIEAYIVLADNQKISDLKLKSRLRKRIPHYGIPDKFFRVPKIPKGITGKINRGAEIKTSE